MKSKRHPPSRSINDNTHQTTRHDTRNRQRNDPTEVDPRNHAPVNGAPGAVAETHADGGTGDALRGGDGEFYNSRVG